MKKSQISKEENKTWAFIYLGLAAAMVITGFWKSQAVWFVFAPIFIALAVFRPYWLDKRLKGNFYKQPR